MMEIPNIMISIYTVSLHVFFFVDILKKKTKHRMAKVFILTSIFLLILSLLSLWGIYLLVLNENVVVSVKLLIVQLLVATFNFVLLANLRQAVEISKS